jgi:hypothetical protein
MKWIFVMILVCFTPSHAEEAKTTKLPRPAVLHTSELSEFGSLSKSRQKLISCALAEEIISTWLPYTPGGADPSDGGFDCSGAMFYVLHNAGLEPPRSSQSQCSWIKDAKKFHEISTTALSLKDPSFAALKPGDLLFWAKLVTPSNGDDSMRVHHVAMYLGTEKKDGRAVIVNATEGRSYRGHSANGYGVYDFRLPKADSPSKLIGYGTPPGISDD